jgi:hypothetical protein
VRYLTSCAAELYARATCTEAVVRASIQHANHTSFICADVVTIAEPCGHSSTLLAARSARRILDRTTSIMNQ